MTSVTASDELVSWPVPSSNVSKVPHVCSAGAQIPLLCHYIRLIAKGQTMDQLTTSRFHEAFS